MGSRRYSLYGKQTALMIAKYFGKTELAVVSGLASGIDTFAHTGVLESARTVVSNIHAQGTPAVEAGAYIAELIGKILQRKVSGVGLHLEEGT